MITPKQLINTLREDFSLSLKDEKIIFILNAFEKKLKKRGIIEKAQVFTAENLGTAALSLSDEDVEVYLYHILLKEAILLGDTARLSIFSSLYNAGLQDLFSQNQKRKISFKNLW